MNIFLKNIHYHKLFIQISLAFTLVLILKYPKIASEKNIVLDSFNKTGQQIILLHLQVIIKIQIHRIFRSSYFFVVLRFKINPLLLF